MALFKKEKKVEELPEIASITNDPEAEEVEQVKRLLLENEATKLFLLVEQGRKNYNLFLKLNKQ